MSDDATTPCADDPLEVRLAGIQCRMIRAGKLKYQDP
jgi:hypothetical protein